MMKISLESRVLGGWRGKSVGGTLGLPAEGKRGPLNFRFYNPVPTSAPPNDDLELQLVWLHVMEQQVGPLTPEIMAQAWKDHIHYMWDEYGRARWNLRRGVAAEVCGIFENPFQSCMGSPIRSEIWACVAAAKPELAAKFARLDSLIDHGQEGIAGEVFLAVWQALVLGGTELFEGLEAALAAIEPHTELRAALEFVRSLHAKKTDCWAAREELLRAYDDENFTDAPLNVALTLWAILYGGGDFEKTILLAVNGGYDTDCTAATAGAILGMVSGAEGLPVKWTAPLGDSLALGPGIIGIDCPADLLDLTLRSLALRDKADGLTPRLTEKMPELPALESLPGTIRVGGVPWANGELTAEVKAAGGGTWEWKSAEAGAAFRVICLAREGARLWIDGKQVVDCPAGVAYVPATHRPAQESRALMKSTGKPVEVRVELNSRDPKQGASVILADAALHLAPWTGEVLPFAPRLPAELK